jgi:enoyl-CoA hydratase
MNGTVIHTLPVAAQQPRIALMTASSSPSRGGDVHFEQRGATAVITFDRPEARNAMTWAMYEQLDRALDRIASNDHARVTILRGTGGHFVAGTDIAQFMAFQTADDGVSYERKLETIVAKLEALRTPTIAAIDGFAAGAGLVLAAACDLRVCTPSARFGVPIARNVGNSLSMANYARLVALIGAARTKQLLMTAGFMDAADARAVGFVIDVVEADALDREVDALAQRVASLAPVTLDVTKEAIRRVVALSFADGDDLLRRAYDSRDFHEGVAAWVEKRAPNWEGR